MQGYFRTDTLRPCIFVCFFYIFTRRRARSTGNLPVKPPGLRSRTWLPQGSKGRELSFGAAPPSSIARFYFIFKFLTFLSNSLRSGDLYDDDSF